MPSETEASGVIPCQHFQAGGVCNNPAHTDSLRVCVCHEGTPDAPTTEMARQLRGLLRIDKHPFCQHVSVI